MGDDDGDGRTLQDRLGGDDRDYERIEAREDLDRLLKRVLHERDREILRLRFEHDLTQQEIGDAVGLSQMQVSRLLRAALDRLQAAVDQDEDARVPVAAR